jgi:ketosteroid isomerase-like protein
MDRAGFQEWLDRYVAAWKSYDATDIGELFSEDAEYRYHPQDEPVRGREAIVASWLDEKDDPGSFDAHYEPLAIDGENHVAQGWSRYFADDGKTLKDDYDNIYLCRFDTEGRCREFTEWWVQSRRFRKEAEGDASAA